MLTFYCNNIDIIDVGNCQYCLHMNLGEKYDECHQEDLECNYVNPILE